ncbi:MAG: DNRLRE domain-containing protein [Bacteroidetes bacterium]|nr:DNRLRE domain-containing protein [Bacteroidota bacterium]
MKNYLLLGTVSMLLLFGCDDETDCLIQFTHTMCAQQDARISVKPADIGEANTNYGDFEGLTAQAQTTNSNPVQYRGLLQFDLSSIESGSTILNAKLSLYYNPNSVHMQSSQSGSNACYLQRVISNWDQSTVTWNTQPSITTTNQVTLPQSSSSTQDYPDINVTQLVQDMVDNPAEGQGFLLRLITEVGIQEDDLCFK